MLCVADAPLDIVVSEECQEDSAKKSPSPSTIFEKKSPRNPKPCAVGGGPRTCKRLLGCASSGEGHASCASRGPVLHFH